MEIQVTEEDIRQGVKKAMRACPIALALIRQFKGAEVEVLDSHLLVDNKVYRMTEDMVNFVRDFDKDKPVKPFTFDLDTLMVVYDGK